MEIFADNFETHKFLQVETLLSRVEVLDEKEILNQVDSLNLSPLHKIALQESVLGERTLIDQHLRSDDPFKVWLVHVPEELNYKNKYCWVVGSLDPVGQQVSKLAEYLHSSAIKDNKIGRGGNDYGDRQTPPLIWLRPKISSEVPQPLGSEGNDEFFIYQTPKSNNENLINDFDQQLVINAERVEKLAQIGIERAMRLFNAQSNSMEILRKNVNFLSKLHLEGHNQGHFLGPWPLDRQKKDHESYDFIEELRACLMSVYAYDRTGASNEEVEALAMQVLFSRLLVHGNTAFNVENGKRNRQSVREVIVPAVLFGYLMNEEAFAIEKGSYTIYPDKIVTSMFKFLEEIGHVESNAYSTRSNKILHNFVIDKLKMTFPDGNYHPDFINIQHSVSNE